MNKSLIIILFPLFLYGFNLFGSNDKNSENIDAQKTIAIGKFQLKGKITQSQYADILADFRSYIDDQFSKNSTFKVINKSNLDEILSANGVYEEKSSFDFKNFEFITEKVKKNKQFNAEYVLFGEIKNFELDKLRGSKLNNGEIANLSKKEMVLDSYVSIALIHIKTQEIVAKENIQIRETLQDVSSSNTLISNALNLLADKIVSKLLLSMTKEIKVISIQNDEVVLNKGRQNGIKKGMSFDIFNIKNIEGYTTQEKIATVKIKRSDKKISFATLENIIQLPQKGNLARHIENKKKGFLEEKIRIAIGETIIERSNVKTSALSNYINRDMEYVFSQNRAFVVTNNNKSQTNKILAQQILDELSKGRETGLPLGSLRGVDYLVFNTIEYIEFNNKKVKIEFLKSLGLAHAKTQKAKAKLSGYTYLVDVNTGNKVASIPVVIQHEFSPKESLFEILMKYLSQKFVTVASYQLFNQISPLRIVRINGMSVLLNGGKNIGIKIGNVYTVYSKGEMITDNKTGQSYMSGGMPVAKIRIDSFSNRDEAVGIITQGNITQTDLEVKLDKTSNKDKHVLNKRSFTKLDNSIDKKSNKPKYVALKDLTIDTTISSFKHKYLHEAQIDKKIHSAINKSGLFKTLSRDKGQIKQLAQERQIALSSLSKEYDESELHFKVADYILIPKVTKFKLFNSSEKIEYIESYENKVNFELEISLTLINRDGEVIFDGINSDKYSKSWASKEKEKSLVKRTDIYKLADKTVKKVVNDLISNSLEIKSDGLITVVEVGKLGIFVDLANKKDVGVGDKFYVYSKPKVKELSRTGKKRLSYGSRIAEVEIDAIFEDGAEAVVTKGNLEDIKENFILRNKY